MKKDFNYKNIEIIGYYPYKAIYKLTDGKYFTLCIADGNETKKDVMNRAKKCIDYMNEKN